MGLPGSSASQRPQSGGRGEASPGGIVSAEGKEKEDVEKAASAKRRTSRCKEALVSACAHGGGCMACARPTQRMMLHPQLKHKFSGQSVPVMRFLVVEFAVYAPNSNASNVAPVVLSVWFLVFDFALCVPGRAARSAPPLGHLSYLLRSCYGVPGTHLPFAATRTSYSSEGTSSAIFLRTR
eukprot:3420428-Rhodomonas_salina.3